MFTYYQISRQDLDCFIMQEVFKKRKLLLKTRVIISQGKQKKDKPFRGDSRNLGKVK